MPDDAGAPLSRASAAAVLQSLLTAEIAAARGRKGAPSTSVQTERWAEDQRIGDGALRCDSLEAMWLQAAVNEMFHLHEVDAVGALASDLRFGAWIDAIESAWLHGVSRITFATSGSTGLPKRCTHGFDSLHAEARHLATLFGGRRRVVAATPAHHIFGFILTALLSDALGVAVLHAGEFGAGRLSRELRDGDLVVTFPEKWAWIERSLPSLPPGIEGVVSTAPCPIGLAETLSIKGLDALTDIYGSSETAGVATRTLPSEDRYALMPHWQFAVEGTELIRRDGVRFQPPDRLNIHPDGRFTLEGRVDGAVQVGGINVWPAKIADRIRAVRGVADVVVRPMRDDEGRRLKAFIVPSGQVAADDLLVDVGTWVETHLPPEQRPTAITIGARLPVSSTGKPSDW